MKRFVDIRNQGIGYCFAWWNTVADTFEDYDGSIAWNTWLDFECDYEGNEIIRYKSLCPEWVFDENNEDDIEGFYG